MYYFRINDDGKWKDSKLDGKEVQKIQQGTTVQCIKTFILIQQIEAALKKKGSLKRDLTETERLAIFDKVAPDYGSIAVDFIRDNLAKRKSQKEQSG